jgi:hypothetical protein
VNPDVGVVLETVAAKLLFEMAPQMQPPFMQGTVTVLGLLLSMLREEWDRCAQRRVDENQAMRQLFRHALAHVGDDGLRRRLADAAEGADASVRLSDLDAANDGLRSLLIELHAHVEEQPGAAAREVEERIWQELLASTERRRLSLAPF